MSVLSPGRSASPTMPAASPCSDATPPSAGLAAPDRLGLDDLGGDAGGDADERAADQRGEDDDRRRSRVPAARPELDDDALRRGCRDDERNRHRQRTSRALRPRRTTQSAVASDRDERDPDRNAGTARRVGNAWSWTASSVLAPSPPCRSWTRHPQLIKREQRPRAISPDSGEAGRENPVYRRF